MFAFVCWAAEADPTAAPMCLCCRTFAGTQITIPGLAVALGWVGGVRRRLVSEKAD